MERSLLPILFFFLVLVGLPCLAQELVIEKIEPPNWWADMETNEVQLMLYGQQLQNLKVTGNCSNMSVIKVYENVDSSYAFIDVRVNDEGTCELLFSNEYGSQSIEYTIEKRRETERVGFNREDVVYLITPDRFANGDPENDVVDDLMNDYDPNDPEKRHGGDLQGIIDHLDYLQDLGVSCLWLNPILENSGTVSYHGYAQTDLYRVDPRFGDNELYRTLCDSARARGMKVIMDHVANHIGIGHPWMTAYPTENWVHGTVDNHLRDKHFMHAITDPNADPASEKMLRDFWFVDSMPDLNQQDPLLAKYIIQNTIWWIEYAGLSGVREDTYPYADQDFMREWAKAVMTEYPQLNIVGEIWSTQPSFLAHFQGESKMPGAFDTHLPCVMDFPLMAALRNFLEEKGNLNDVYEVISQDYLYPDPDNLMVFVGNHDNPRAAYVAGKDYDKCKIAFGIAMTTRGIPQILYGEEIGLFGGQSHTLLRQQFPGGFPHHEESAFTEMERDETENDMYDFFQLLIHIRDLYPTLVEGEFYQYPTKWWEKDVYKYMKITDYNRILVMANGSENVVFVDVEDQWEHLKDYRLLHNLMDDKSVLIEENMEVELQPHQFAVFLLR